MGRLRLILPVALSFAIGACTSAVSPSHMPASTVQAASGALAPSPLPTLASTVEPASEAPDGAVPITMTVTDVNHPRFQPDKVTATAGTVVFYLHNVPVGAEMPDHAMVIGASDVQFYPDGSVKSGQVLADSGHVVANDEAVFTVTGLGPGTYKFWCNVNVAAGDGTHETNGMTGTLTVTP
jgi:plastocyanin